MTIGECFVLIIFFIMIISMVIVKMYFNYKIELVRMNKFEKEEKK